MVLEDKSSEAYSFFQSLKHSKYFDVVLEQEESLLKKKMTSGEIQGIVVIPFYFNEYLKRNESAPIYVISNGESPNTASFVQNYIEGFWQNYLVQQKLESAQKKPPIAILEPRFWYNPELNSHYFLVPGSIAIIMTLIGTLLTALVVAREWERGTMESLLTTPIVMWEFLLSKIIAYFILGSLSFIFCFLVSISLFQVPYSGSVLLLFIVSSIFLITALSGGLFISTFSKDQFIASQMAIMSSFLPAYSLSGFIFETTSMPKIIQIISAFIPAKYFVSSLQTLYLVGNVSTLISKNILFLLLLCLLPLSYTLIKTKKRIN